MLFRSRECRYSAIESLRLADRVIPCAGHYVYTVLHEVRRYAIEFVTRRQHLLYVTHYLVCKSKRSHSFFPDGSRNFIAPFITPVYGHPLTLQQPSQGADLQELVIVEHR